MRALPEHDRAGPRRPGRDAAARHAGPRSRTTAPSTCGSARTASRRVLPGDAPFAVGRATGCADGGDVTIAARPARSCPRRVGAAERLRAARRRRRRSSTSARVKPLDAARRPRRRRTARRSSPSRSTPSSAASAAPWPRCSPRPAPRPRLRRIGLRDDVRPRGRLARPPARPTTASPPTPSPTRSALGHCVTERSRNAHDRAVEPPTAVRDRRGAARSSRSSRRRQTLADLHARSIVAAPAARAAGAGVRAARRRRAR